MRALVHQAMEQGALGVTTALIYNPNTYAKTPELIALAEESAHCGGMYIAHMRSEGDRIVEAVQETIDIAKGSGAPAEIYHLKVAGQVNWNKLDAVIKQVESARAAGTRITADMYLYTAGATGLDVSMPAWVQEGGLDKWIERLKDPAIRARVLAEMREPSPTWENLLQRAGAQGRLAAGIQESRLEAADRQDLGRSCEDARREPGRGGDATGRRGWIAGGRGLLFDVGGERSPRSGVALGQFRFRRQRAGARGRVPAIQRAPARLRQFRARTREVRARRKGRCRPSRPSAS